MRGRGGGGGNPGRKGPNPLSRTYESTGPDVKIRGTALHIAEKYVSLARDAQSSGDPVLAESYLQHAEHYYRIIAAAQAAMPQPMPVIRSDIQTDDDEDDGDDGYAETRFDTRGRGIDPRTEVNGNGEGHRSDTPREPRGDGRGEGRPYRRAINVEAGEGYGQGDASRGEGRAPTRRAIDVESGDPYMSVDTPQPFVDDSALERVVAERGDDRRQSRGRNRFRDRGEFRGEGRAEGARSEGGRPEGREGRPLRERPARGEGRYDREPREARSEAAEPALDALPAFLTAAPRVAPAPAPAPAPVVAPATEPIVEAAETGDAEAPRRRTRGGRGRGRRPEFEGGEAAAPAPAGAED